MTAVYQKEFHIHPTDTDRFNRLKPSHLLSILQSAAGDHSDLLGADRQALTRQNLFWAVIRHRVQITRLPGEGEDITVQTWPMPTTRTAYPRSAVALSKDGKELFRSISLWVLMDEKQRSLVLPGKSGVTVEGLIRGDEIPAPGSLMPGHWPNESIRRVHFSDLDRNGHMNNCRYLDWVIDTLPSEFHENHMPREFSLCYHAEAREDDLLSLNWALSEDGCLAVDASRKEGRLSTGQSRVFSARMLF